MKYLIYLFQILVLGYISEINTSDGSDNHTWMCASEGCDAPIAEVRTVGNRKFVSQNEDLAYQLGEQGKGYKMSSGANPQWLVEINGKRGLVPENQLKVFKWIKNKDTLVPETKLEATSASERKLEILGTQFNAGDLEAEPGMAGIFDSDVSAESTSHIDQARYPGPPELTKSGLNLTLGETAPTDQKLNTPETNNPLSTDPVGPDGSREGAGLTESPQTLSSDHSEETNSSTTDTTAKENPDLTPVETDMANETVSTQSVTEPSPPESVDKTADVAGVPTTPSVGPEQVVGQSPSQTEQFNAGNVDSSYLPDTGVSPKGFPEEPIKVLEVNQKSSPPNPLEVSNDSVKTPQEDTDDGMVETEDNLVETVISEESNKEPTPVNPEPVIEAQSSNMPSSESTSPYSVPSTTYPETTDGSIKTNSSLENSNGLNDVPVSKPAYPQQPGYQNYPSSDVKPSSVPQTEYSQYGAPYIVPKPGILNQGLHHGVPEGSGSAGSPKLNNGVAGDTSATNSHPPAVSSPAIEPPSNSIISPVMEAGPSINVDPTSAPTSPDSPSDKVDTPPNDMAQKSDLPDSGSPSFKLEDKASTPIETVPQADSTPVPADFPDETKSSVHEPEPNVPDGASPTSDAQDQEIPQAVPETTELPAEAIAEPDSSEPTAVSDNTPESSDNGEQTSWYASIGTGLSYFSELFAKSELPTPESSNHLSESDYCHKDGDCPTADSTPDEESSHASIPVEETKEETKPSSEGSPYTYEKPPERDGPHPSMYQEEMVYTKAPETSPTMSLNSLLYIGITSVVILIFSLGYYYIEKNSRLTELIGQMNALSQELFITKKERDTLEEQLMKVEENYTMMDTTKMRQDSEVILLQKALEESRSAQGVLEESVARLEKEVETLMENGMEMHNLLSETISEEERSQLLLANIEELKGSLDARLEEIVALTDQLNKRNEEIQLLQLDVRNGNDKQRELERKLEGCKAEVEQESTVVIHQLQQKIIKLQQLVEEKSVEGARLEGELVRVRTEAAGEAARATAAEAALQEAHAVGAGKARTQWLDATQARAEMARTEQRAKDLAAELASAHTNSQHLQEKINALHKEISLMNSKYENVEKDKVNALTKLQVLSDYFKEKESKLQEELGMKESLWLQKESEDHTIYEQMKSLREEISSYKAQNETLKAEIIEQESSYKVQIANEEQKSYDNWVALRQAERKIKELQNEASHFRNMITQMESAGNHSGPINPNGVDLGKGFMGVSAPSPPFMVGGPPPPPLEIFLPPPPAARPPPLGRISSPPLPADLLPPPPLIPFDFLPHPPSSSTPPPPPIFKPQPRDRPPKDSPPSNYSPESPNEKPIRRRRR